MIHTTHTFNYVKSPTPSAPIWTEYTPHGNPTRPRVNNRSIYQNAIMNQLGLGDCAGVSSTEARMAAHTLAGLPYAVLSALAEYYEARVIMGTVTQDSGQTTSAMVEVYEKYGAMLDQYDPYANYAQTWKNPPPNDWDATLKLAPSQVLHTNTLQSYKELVDAGYPVLVAFGVFDELEGGLVANTGWLTMPANPANSIGGHMVNGIGYSDELGAVLIMNQWGAQWGLKQAGLEGCFWMPYEYFNAYVFDIIAFAPDNNVPVKQTATPAPFVKPQLDTYTVSVSFSPKSLNVGQSSTMSVKCLKNGASWVNANVNAQFQQGANIIIAQSLTSDANGECHLTVSQNVAGIYEGDVVVYDAYMSLHTASDTVNFVATTTLPTNVCDLIEHHSGVVYDGATCVPPQLWERAGSAKQLDANHFQVNGKTYAGDIQNGTTYIHWEVMRDAGYTLNQVHDANGKLLGWSFTK